MRHANNEKWESVYNGRNTTAKSEKHLNTLREEISQELRNIGNGQNERRKENKKGVREKE